MNAKFLNKENIKSTLFSSSLNCKIFRTNNTQLEKRKCILSKKDQLWKKLYFSLWHFLLLC